MKGARRRSSLLRRPRTYQEIKAWGDATAQGVTPRRRRAASRIVTSWDDNFFRPTKDWKRRRAHQYRP